MAKQLWKNQFESNIFFKKPLIRNIIDPKSKCPVWLFKLYGHVKSPKDKQRNCVKLDPSLLNNITYEKLTVKKKEDIYCHKNV